jgi:hypothetical protein
MRFYLNVPLVAGYLLMAIPACLGMLQFAAARGGYAGLSLFSDDRKAGTRIGVGLVLGSAILYAAFAPDIHTPGPAGTEITEMFLVCALLAMVVTVAGAHWRLKRRRTLRVRGESVNLEDSRAIRLGADASMASSEQRPPTVIVCCDPTGFVTLPAALLDEFGAAGITVLLLGISPEAGTDASLSRSALLGVLSLALTHLRDDERVGLLGLGLAGDAVLTAAMGSSHAAAALAVSPVLTAPSLQADAGPGLHWLHELSLPQSWRWCRQRPVYQESIADLYNTVRASTSPSKPVAILCDSEPAMTTRRFADVRYIITPEERHFTVLEVPVNRRTLIQWFQKALG